MMEGNGELPKDNTHLFKKEEKEEKQDSQPPQEEKMLQLIIMAKDGEPIQVKGCIDNEVFATFLLEKAKRILDLYWEARAFEEAKMKEKLFHKPFPKIGKALGWKR